MTFRLYSRICTRVFKVKKKAKKERLIHLQSMFLVIFRATLLGRIFTVLPLGSDFHPASREIALLVTQSFGEIFFGVHASLMVNSCGEISVADDDGELLIF